MKENAQLLTGFDDYGHQSDEFLDAVFAGLAKPQKRISSKYFYDEIGSKLFEEICSLEEYYPTRTELALLRKHAGDIANAAGPGAAMIEFGSGASLKERILLDALDEPAAYIPVDISKDHLFEAARALAVDYPDLPVHGICADYTRHFELPDIAARGNHFGFFPGSTIGNFTRVEAAEFLAKATGTLGQGAGMVVGVDLKKDPRLLHAAYNDAKGVTAAFNLNLLHRINREFGAEIDVDTFSHVARYDAPGGFVEMRLRSEAAQTITVCGRKFSFAEGETIHTEYSCKYEVEEFQDLAKGAGMKPLHCWVDDDHLFSIHYLEVI
jgi:dimethylhistidine N-methyltransferase